MAKIFTKLHIGEAVATSGTRVFKMLTTEKVTPSVPIWNGTDLTGTNWFIPDGWTAEAGYGEFLVCGSVATNKGDGTFSATAFDKLFIGGSLPMFGNNMVANSDILGYLSGTNIKGVIFGKSKSGGDSEMDTSLQLAFTGGTDVTNTSLINWLLENGTLTSHQFNIKGTWRFNDTITELPIVYADGEDLPAQTAVCITFDAQISKLPCTEIRTYIDAERGNSLFYSTFASLPLYYFDTNSWDYPEARCVVFRDATATNRNNEDITTIFYKWLTANATKQGQITFTIDGTTYQADDGMSWRQWIESDYNTGGYGYYILSDVVLKGSYTVATNDGTVKTGNIIIAGYDYIHY